MVDGRFHAAFIRISYDHEGFCLFGQLLDLIICQRCSQWSHCVPATDFMHTDHIRIAFNQEYGFCVGNFPECLIMTEYLFAFSEYLGSCCVQIFDAFRNLFTIADISSGESEDPSGFVCDRKDDPFPECIIVFSGVRILLDKSGFQKDFYLMACLG